MEDLGEGSAPKAHVVLLDWAFRVITLAPDRPLFSCFSCYCHCYWRRQWHPLQHSCLENPTDGGAWWAAVHGVVKSQTRLSDFTFTFHFPALEKETAAHSSVLARGIPGMGSHRVGHD